MGDDRRIVVKVLLNELSQQAGEGGRNIFLRLETKNDIYSLVWFLWKTPEELNMQKLFPIEEKLVWGKNEGKLERLYFRGGILVQVWLCEGKMEEYWVWRKLLVYCRICYVFLLSPGHIPQEGPPLLLAGPYHTCPNYTGAETPSLGLKTTPEGHLTTTSAVAIAQPLWRAHTDHRGYLPPVLTADGTSEPYRGHRQIKTVPSKL